MKRKYQGVAVLSMGVIAITAIGLYFASGMWIGSDAVANAPRRKAIHIKVPTDEQVQQMDKLYDRMGMLTVPSQRKVAGEKLSLFGYQGRKQSVAVLREKELEGLGRREFQLSLVVVAGIQNYCIIDGSFMAEGASMDDGTKVLKIESHRVLIARNQERKWIYLRDETMSTMTGETKEASVPQKGQS